MCETIVQTLIPAHLGMPVAESKAVAALKAYIDLCEKAGFLLKSGESRFLGPPGALLRRNMIELWRRSVDTTGAYPCISTSRASSESQQIKDLPRAVRSTCQYLKSSHAVEVPYMVVREGVRRISTSLKAVLSAFYGPVSTCTYCDLYYFTHPEDVGTSYDSLFRRRLIWWKEASNWSSNFDGVMAKDNKHANLCYLGFSTVSSESRLPNKIIHSNDKSILEVESVTVNKSEEGHSICCSLNVDAAVAFILLDSLKFSLEGTKVSVGKFSFHPLVAPYKLLVLEIVPENCDCETEIRDLTRRLRYSFLLANFHHCYRRIILNSAEALNKSESGSMFKNVASVKRVWETFQTLGVLRIVIVSAETVETGMVEIALHSLSVVEQAPIAYVKPRLLQELMPTMTIDDDGLLS
ncbi:hypothetical protein M514_00166 [Trichuris suis]|uniref:DNA polymerase subunit gamma-2, mitochondrial n=1 Tax=Trichuris suis TaxID=68888 RepID=A0A085NU89_9BILA|nr:hypothetical protein M514_00166 [Trichuris suis]KHJ46161.1 hypothetical protein D918_03825 [Trichuris suis]